MNQRDSPADEPADKNLIGRSDHTKDCVDVMTLWVRPPAALDGFADDGFGKPGRGPLGRSEDDAVTLDECQCFLGSGACRHDAYRIKRAGGAPRGRGHACGTYVLSDGLGGTLLPMIRTLATIAKNTGRQEE